MVQKDQATKPRKTNNGQPLILTNGHFNHLLIQSRGSFTSATGYVHQLTVDEMTNNYKQATCP